MGVGGRAVLGVVVIGAVVGLLAGLVLQGGGDDAAEPSAGSRPSIEPAEDEDEQDDELSEDEPAAAFAFDLEAGDALRVSVQGLDSALFVAVAEDDVTDGFDDVLGPTQDVREDRAERQAEVLAGEVGDDPEEAVPELSDHLVFVSTDRSGDDVEGIQVVAPADGSYLVVVTGDEGAFELTSGIETGDADGLDPDGIDYLDYLAHYGEHVDHFCDEDFYGGDPRDVTNYGPTICDEDELAGTLSGQFSGDFTNDFGGGESVG
jgi:hypothetical protein